MTRNYSLFEKNMDLGKQFHFFYYIDTPFYEKKHNLLRISSVILYILSVRFINQVIAIIHYKKYQYN